MKRYIKSSYESPYDRMNSRVAWGVDFNEPLFGYIIKTGYYDVVLYANSANAAKKAGANMVKVLRDVTKPFDDEMDEEALANAVLDKNIFPDTVGIAMEGITDTDVVWDDDYYLTLIDGTKVEFAPVGSYRYRI